MTPTVSLVAESQSGPFFLAILFLLLGIVAIGYGIKTLRRGDSPDQRVSDRPPEIETKMACPHCGQHIALTEAFSLQTVACPLCANSIVIPDLRTTVDPEPGSFAPPALNGRALARLWALALAALGCVICGWLERGPYAILARGFSGQAERYSITGTMLGSLLIWLAIPVGLCLADPLIRHPLRLAAFKRKAPLIAAIVCGLIAILAGIQIVAPSSRIPVQDLKEAGAFASFWPTQIELADAKALYHSVEQWELQKTLRSSTTTDKYFVYDRDRWPSDNCPVIFLGSFPDTQGPIHLSARLAPIPVFLRSSKYLGYDLTTGVFLSNPHSSKAFWEIVLTLSLIAMSTLVFIIANARTGPRLQHLPPAPGAPPHRSGARRPR